MKKHYVSIHTQLKNISFGLNVSFIILLLLLLSFTAGGFFFIDWAKRIDTGHETFASGLIGVSGAFLGTVVCTLIFELFGQSRKIKNVSDAITIIEVLDRDDESPTDKKMNSDEYDELLGTLKELHKLIIGDVWSTK